MKPRNTKEERSILCDTEWFYWRIVSLFKEIQKLEDEIVRVRQRVSNLEKRILCVTDQREKT